jgi:GNAT superfamily N-acetyltransferase
MPLPAPITIRRARLEDAAPLREMQALAMRVLGAGYYSPGQIEAFLTHVGTLDDFLLQEGGYHLAEAGGMPIASGGWSLRRAAYEATAAQDGINGGRPKIRSVFVHPHWVRRGLARRLVTLAETEAWAAGHTAIDLAATLSGMPLYEALGYVPLGRAAITLPGGIEMAVTPMRKLLDPPAAIRAAG